MYSAAGGRPPAIGYLAGTSNDIESFGFAFSDPLCEVVECASSAAGRALSMPLDLPAVVETVSPEWTRRGARETSSGSTGPTGTLSPVVNPDG